MTRLATFNILHGRPVSGPSDHATDDSNRTVESADNTARLTQAIADLGADVIGLQEVDVDQPRSGSTNQVRAIAEAVGAADWRFVPTVIGTPGGIAGFRATTAAERESEERGELTGPRYGIGLISKLPVLSWHTQLFAPASFSLPLLVQTDGRPRVTRVRDELRAAIAVVVESSSGPLTIATVHLSFVPGWNVKQLRQLRAWLTSLPKPLVLMGDFNLPTPIPARTSGLQQILKAPTFPSYRPRIQFDHVLLDGFSAAQVAHARSSSRVIATGISDHCAVTVELR